MPEVPEQYPAEERIDRLRTVNAVLRSVVHTVRETVRLASLHHSALPAMLSQLEQAFAILPSREASIVKRLEVTRFFRRIVAEHADNLSKLDAPQLAAFMRLVEARLGTVPIRHPWPEEHAVARKVLEEIDQPVRKGDLEWARRINILLNVSDGGTRAACLARGGEEGMRLKEYIRDVAEATITAWDRPDNRSFDAYQMVKDLCRQHATMEESPGRGDIPFGIRRGLAARLASDTVTALTEGVRWRIDSKGFENSWHRHNAPDSFHALGGLVEILSYLAAVSDGANALRIMYGADVLKRLQRDFESLGGLMEIGLGYPRGHGKKFVRVDLRPFIRELFSGSHPERFVPEVQRLVRSLRRRARNGFRESTWEERQGDAIRLRHDVHFRRDRTSGQEAFDPEAIAKRCAECLKNLRE